MLRSHCERHGSFLSRAFCKAVVIGVRAGGLGLRSVEEGGGSREEEMDLKQLHAKLGVCEQGGGGRVLRKAQELQRLSRAHFDACAFGVGETCKAVLCVELACLALHVPFDRQRAVRSSGLSEKAYVRSFRAMQNALGLGHKVDVRELAVKFGCVRLIGVVERCLALYRERFVAALPEARRASADFDRPVFASVAFYLSVKKHKLKVDKTKLMELCATSSSEFGQVVASMTDLCFDVVGARKTKPDPQSIKCNRELLDALPGKRKGDDDESDSNDDSSEDEDGVEIPGHKRSKKARDSHEWKASVFAERDAIKRIMSETNAARRRPAKQKQLQLSFARVIPPPAS